jgi:hypothetical protein
VRKKWELVLRVKMRNTKMRAMQPMPMKGAPL